jgi:hypothetical protein
MDMWSMKGQLNAFPGIAKENFFGGTGAWAQGFSSLLDRCSTTWEIKAIQLWGI